jgi:hypothetical protein
MADYYAVRNGNKKSQTGIKLQDRFFQEFDAMYAEKLTEAHLSILNRRKTQFVSFKTLNFALRFIATAIKNRRLYTKVC